MKYIKISVCFLFVSLLLCSCGKKKQNAVTEVQTETQFQTTQEVSSKETTAASTTKSTTKSQVTTTQASTEKATLAQYGDSAFTNDTSIKFVQAVIAKYGIEEEGLACVYSTKGKDNNYVWQFNGSRDENGKLIRTADTLKYVYYVNADCSTVCKTGGYTDNDGFTKQNGVGTFLLTQKVLIPQMQDQLNS